MGRRALVIVGTYFVPSVPHGMPPSSLASGTRECYCSVSEIRQLRLKRLVFRIGAPDGDPTGNEGDVLSAWAALTDTRDWEVEAADPDVLPSWRLGGPRSRCLQNQCLARACFLAS